MSGIPSNLDCAAGGPLPTMVFVEVFAISLTLDLTWGFEVRAFGFSKRTHRCFAVGDV
jgi:hypothetical protein